MPTLQPHRSTESPVLKPAAIKRAELPQIMEFQHDDTRCKPGRPATSADVRYVYNKIIVISLILVVVLLVGHLVGIPIPLLPPN